MEGYIIDADWVIDALAKAPRAQPLDGLLDRGVVISWVTVGELYDGAYGRAPNPQLRLGVIKAFLAPFRKIPVDEPVIERFAEVRAHLRRQGQMISDFDIILGATALHYDLTVLTFNLAHFQRIPGIKIFHSS